MSEKNSTLENSIPKPGDTIETQVAVDNAIKSIDEIAAEYDKKVQAEIDRKVPLPQPRNRAERRALKYNKQKRDHAKHLDELRKRVQIQIYMDAIKKMENFEKKMEDKLHDSDEADVGV